MNTTVQDPDLCVCVCVCVCVCDLVLSCVKSHTNLVRAKIQNAGSPHRSFQREVNALRTVHLLTPHSSYSQECEHMFNITTPR